MYFSGWSIQGWSQVRLSPGNTGQLWLIFNFPQPEGVYPC